jgi:hypothetical protein
MFPKTNKVEPIELTKLNEHKQTLTKRKKEIFLLIFLVLFLLTLVVLAILLPIVLTNNQENQQITWSSNSYSTTRKDSKLTSSKSFLNLNETIPQTTKIEYESSHSSTSSFENKTSTAVDSMTNENHLTSPTSRTFSSTEYTVYSSSIFSTKLTETLFTQNNLKNESTPFDFTSNALDLNETNTQTTKTDPSYSQTFKTETDISSISNTIITNEISLTSSFNLSVSSKTTLISLISESTPSDFTTSIDNNISSSTYENQTSFTTSNLLESSSFSTFEYSNDVSIISESFYATSTNSTTFVPISTTTKNTFLSTTTDISSTATTTTTMSFSSSLTTAISTSTFTTKKNFEGLFLENI